MVYMLKFINTFDKFNPRPFPKNRKHSRNDPVALMYQFIRILQWFCCYFYSNVCIRQGFYSVEYFLFAFCLSSIFILLQHYTNNVTKIFFWFSEIFQKDLWVFSPLKASVEPTHSSIFSNLHVITPMRSHNMWCSFELSIQFCIHSPRT